MEMSFPADFFYFDVWCHFAAVYKPKHNGALDGWKVTYYKTGFFKQSDGSEVARTVITKL